MWLCLNSFLKMRSELQGCIVLTMSENKDTNNTDTTCLCKWKKSCLVKNICKIHALLKITSPVRLLIYLNFFPLRYQESKTFRKRTSALVHFLCAYVTWQASTDCGTLLSILQRQTQLPEPESNTHGKWSGLHAPTPTEQDPGPDMCITLIVQDGALTLIPKAFLSYCSYIKSRIAREHRKAQFRNT